MPNPDPNRELPEPGLALALLGMLAFMLLGTLEALRDLLRPAEDPGRGRGRPPG